MAVGPAVCIRHPEIGALCETLFVGLTLISSDSHFGRRQNASKSILMKTNQVVLELQTDSPELRNDSTKLVSLLALAAGAIAMPQTGSADIIYTDLGGSPATVNYLGEYQVIIPGTADFRIKGQTSSVMGSLLTIKYRSVVAGDFGPASTPPVQVRGIAGFAAPLNYGQTWNAGAAVLFNKAWVGTADDSFRNNPSVSYDHKYLAFRFGNSDQGGAIRYGWMDIGLTVRGYNAGGPLVTIYRYGWDNTGAQPTMGQVPVPEPSSAAIVALGAMALGARGVRSWRQKRDAATVE